MKLLTMLTALLAILLIVLSGPLYKMGVVDLKGMLALIQGTALAGFATIILALIQMIFMRKSINWSATLGSVAVAIIALVFPLGMIAKGGSVPRIHDITTDLVNPPQFQAILPLRAGSMNPPEYLGEEVAAQQRAGYPDLSSKKYTQSAEQVFDAVVQSVSAMGLELIASNKTTGVIEATDTSTWFGFVDDVVVRIQTEGDMTVLDVRSKSRVGISDLGKNAERINTLIAGVEKQLEI